MRLILVRHPRPQIAHGVCYGSSDIPAQPEHQAQVLAELLASLPNAALVTSPLRRCAELAAQLALHRSTALSTDQRLAEMHFGDWEMRPWDDIPRTDVDAWAADLVHYRPGGGESVLAVVERVSAFYADVQRRQRDVIAICHAGTMRVLEACQHGLSLPEIALRAAQEANQIPYGASRIMHL
jgi:alpha-ribazole phosphatase